MSKNASSSSAAFGGRGPSGDCLCPKCGARLPHVKGTPCRDLRCPDCGSAMVREGGYHDALIKENASKKGDIR